MNQQLTTLRAYTFKAIRTSKADMEKYPVYLPKLRVWVIRCDNCAGIAGNHRQGCKAGAK